MTQEVLKLALEALKTIDEAMPFPVAKLAQAAIKEALAQSEQEPVAWPCLIAEADFSEDTVTLAMQCTDYKVSAGKHWLSNTPPQRTWVGLTDEEISEVLGSDIHDEPSGELRFIRAIEAKLMERNT